MMTAPKNENEQLRARLNLETSRMPWSELLRHFAAGTVIQISKDLDLIDVAVCISADDTASIKQWMLENRVIKVSDAQAQSWLESDALVWAVVVKPWVLVQETDCG